MLRLLAIICIVTNIIFSVTALQILFQNEFLFLFFSKLPMIQDILASLVALYQVLSVCHVVLGLEVVLEFLLSFFQHVPIECLQYQTCKDIIQRMLNFKRFFFNSQSSKFFQTFSN